MKERWSLSNDKLVALESGHSIEGDELQKEKYTKSNTWYKTLLKYTKWLILLQIAIFLLWVCYEMWQIYPGNDRVDDAHFSSHLYPEIYMTPQNQFADSVTPEIITSRAEMNFKEVSTESPTPIEVSTQFPKGSLGDLVEKLFLVTTEKTNFETGGFEDKYNDNLKNVEEMSTENDLITKEPEEYLSKEPISGNVFIKPMKGDELKQEYYDDPQYTEIRSENDLVTEEPVTDESLTKNDETTSSEYQFESNAPSSNIEESPKEESSETLVENSTEESYENIPSTSAESTTNVNTIAIMDLDKKIRNLFSITNSQLEFALHPILIDLASNKNQFTMEKEDMFSKLEGFDESTTETDYPSYYEEYDLNYNDHDWNDSIKAYESILKLVKDYHISDTSRPENDNEESSETDKNLDSSTVEDATTTESAKTLFQWGDYEYDFDTSRELDKTLEDTTMYFDKDVYDMSTMKNNEEESSEADKNWDSSTVEDATTTKPVNRWYELADYEDDYDSTTKDDETFKDGVMYFDKDIYDMSTMKNNEEESSEADKNWDSSTVEDATTTKPVNRWYELADYEDDYASTTKDDETFKDGVMYFDKDIYDMSTIRNNEESSEADKNWDSSTVEDATTTKPVKRFYAWADYEDDYDSTTKRDETFKDDVMYFDKDIYDMSTMRNNEESSEADKNWDSSTVEDATTTELAKTSQDYDSYDDSTEYLKFLEAITRCQILSSEEGSYCLEYIIMEKLMCHIRKLKRAQSMEELNMERANILIELRKHRSESILKELAAKLCNDRDWYTIAALCDIDFDITSLEQDDQNDTLFNEVYLNIKRNVLDDGMNREAESVAGETEYTNHAWDDD